MEPWEAERYDWSGLKGAWTTAAGIPGALELLRTALSDREAEQAFNRIDNTVVVQDALYEPARATAACIVTMLTACTMVSRPRLLELLERISGGEPEPDDEHTVLQIRSEVARGFGTYVGLLQYGTDRERDFCVDLVIASAQVDCELRDRARFYLQKLSSDGHASSRVRDYAARRLAKVAVEWEAN